jgi:hypothetical protein
VRLDAVKVMVMMVRRCACTEAGAEDGRRHKDKMQCERLQTVIVKAVRSCSRCWDMQVEND